MFKREDLPNVLAIVVASVVGAAATMLVVTNQAQDPKAIVKQVCSYSRTVDSGKWEEACGNAQDATNTKYHCDGFEPGATCIVTDKK